MKTHTERVHPGLARQAMEKATQRVAVYSDYIILHFRATGNLAPGCDARDLIAWYEQNMPIELDAITMIRK